jgi:MFS family permease
VLSFAFGFADAFAFPAHSALIPTIVTAEQLPAANSMVQGMVQAATIAGPWPAGYSIKRWGIAQAFFIDAVSFLFIIAALWRLPEQAKAAPGASAPRPKMWHSIIEGLRYVWHDPAIRALMLLSTTLNFAISGPLMIGIAVLAKTRMGQPTAYGQLVMAISAGALAGMVISGVTPRPRHLGTALLGLAVVMGLSMAALGFLHRLLQVAGVLAGMGFVSGFLQVHLISWFQKRVDRTLLGRVMSVLMFGAVGLIPISYAAAGALVQVSLPAMFLASGALMLAVAVVAGITSGLKAIE